MSDQHLQITVNGELQHFDHPMTVAEIVDRATKSSQGCAVAVNGDVIPKSTWDNVTIADNDRVEILTAAPGG